MKNKYKSNIAQIAVILAALLNLPACQDQNLDQYQQAQVDAQLSKEQAVSGAYRGSLVNHLTRATLGNIEIDLTPNSTPTTTSTTQGSNGAQASFLGSMILYQGTAVADKVDFQSIHYYVDSNSGVGNFSGTVNIPITGSSSTATISVTGTISNGTFTGSILSSPSEPIGDFTAALNGSFPSSSGQASTFSSDPTSQQIIAYAGLVPTLPGCLTACPAKVLMNVSFIAPTQAESFLNNFEDNKIGIVTLKFVDPINASRVIQTVPFEQAQIDMGSGEITASGTAGEVVTNIQLFCHADANDAKSRDCTMHTLSNGAVVQFSASPASGQ